MSYTQVGFTLGWELDVWVRLRRLKESARAQYRNWNFTSGAVAPIFNAGRIRSNVRFTEAQQREALIRYERSIQNAFREVSDALIGYRKTVEQREQQELLVAGLRESQRLSTLRYRGGLDSYLQVLDADRNLFQGPDAGAPPPAGTPSFSSIAPWAAAGMRVEASRSRSAQRGSLAGNGRASRPPHGAGWP